MTCACGDGKLCAEHLGAWLDRPIPIIRDDGSCFRCTSTKNSPCDCNCPVCDDTKRGIPSPSWRSFPAEPTCERCIVKVEGGYVMRRCEACRGDNTEQAPANALAELPINESHD
jgi:Zn finger protein HypA/HybF involved in hydrogenase expression